MQSSLKKLLRHSAYNPKDAYKASAGSKPGGFIKKLSRISFSFFMLMAACSQPRPSAFQPQYTDLVDTTGIIGGEEVADSENISQSTVGIGSSGQGVFCTGVLIAENLVLTAAHCTLETAKPHQLKVFFGTDLKSPSVQIRRVLGGRVPEQWTKNRPDNETLKEGMYDIAILRLAEPAPQGFTPVPYANSLSSIRKGTEAVITGFGITQMRPEKIDLNKLMKASVIISDDHYSDTEFSFDFSQKRGSCHGDSGGPAYSLVDGHLTVIGVTSRAPTIMGGITCEEGAVYTSIPAHLDFIHRAIRELLADDFVEDEAIPRPKQNFNP